jgi:hypothetical protein
MEMIELFEYSRKKSLNTDMKQVLNMRGKIQSKNYNFKAIFKQFRKKINTNKKETELSETEMAEYWGNIRSNAIQHNKIQNAFENSVCFKLKR